MEETSTSDRFESLLELLSPWAPSLDPAHLHGMLTAAATTMFPAHEVIANDVAPGCESASDVNGAMLDAIEEIADALPLSKHDVPVEEGAADQGERWLRGYLHSVAIHENEWVYFSEGSQIIRDALAMCRVMVGEGADGYSLPPHVDPQRLLGSPRFLEDMAARIHLAALEVDAETAGLDDGDWDDLPQYEADELVDADEDALIELLLDDGDRLPRNVVDECVRRGGAIVPGLRALIEEWDAAGEADDWWSILHALKILGLIPGPAASAALMEGFVIVHDSDPDMVDWLATDWPALFGGRAHETFEALKRIGEDRESDWYIRSTAAQCALAQATEEGAQSLEDTLDWLAGLVADRDDDDDFRFIAALHVLDFPRERHRGLLDAVADEQVGLPAVDRIFGPDEVEEIFREGDQPEWLHFADPWRFYDEEEILSRQVRRACESREYDEAEDDVDEFDDEYEDDLDLLEPVETFVREQPKVGRNDPCPCGSGKKYKKCCLPLQ